MQRGTTSILLLVSTVCLLCAALDYIPPSQIHLAYSGYYSHIYISWHTTLPTDTPTVLLYDSVLDKNFTYTGSQTSYLKSAGYESVVNITNLRASQKYLYSVGSSNGVSPPFSFRTQPMPSTSTSSFPTTKFLIYGDMGILNSYETVQHVADAVDSGEGDIAFIYHAGDFGYGNDRPAYQYETSWNMFFDRFQLRVMPYVPYMVAPGNHETDCSHDACNFYAANFTVFNTRFNMPSVESKSSNAKSDAKNMFFSWNYNNIHFVTISTETNYPNSPKTGPGYDFGDQLAWLEADLTANANNSETDWIVAVGHRPMYTSYEGDGTGESGGQPIGNGRDMQNAFEDIFHNYGVDLYVDGHIHAYERNFPIYKGKVCGNPTYNTYTSPGCTAYVIAGAAGNTEGHYSKDWAKDPPVWSAHRYWLDFGYGQITVTGNSSLKWEWFRDGDNGRQDWFEITK